MQANEPRRRGEAVAAGRRRKEDTGSHREERRNVRMTRQEPLQQDGGERATQNKPGIMVARLVWAGVDKACTATAPI